MDRIGAFQGAALEFVPVKVMAGVEAEFDAPAWYGVLARERVSVWYTAPTAIRMMMKLGADALRGYDLHEGPPARLRAARGGKHVASEDQRP